MREHLERAEGGRGGTLLVTGPPGVGKSAVLGLAEALARRRGWRTGRGTASAIEGPWPYSAVLEALGDLCRQHPALLDGLDDIYRLEIERALSGRDVSWSGESGHQRLFVAAAELVRLAAAGHGLLLVVDDIQEADQASLRLLHYLSRCAVDEPVLLALAHRRPVSDQVQEMADSLVGRGSGSRIELAPLSRSATRRLLADRFPELDADTVEHIWAASAGLPFTVLELARHQGAGGAAAACCPCCRRRCCGPSSGWPCSARRSAPTSCSRSRGWTRTRATSTSRWPSQACSSSAATAGTASATPWSASRWCTSCRRPPGPPPTASWPSSWPRLGAPPGRVAHHYLAAGQPSRAVPFVVRAVETAGALGAYRDALTLVDAVRAHADPTSFPRSWPDGGTC